MRAWPFSKPKTPGFGISKGYYLTILSSRSVLPSIVEIANPGGTGGAAVGMAVPLGNETDKALLSQPMRIGSYAIATPDRKTVLKMVVLSKEDAGFDPEWYAQSVLAEHEDPELVARLRATWTIAQLTFESHDPTVYPALDFFLGIAIRLATISEGVVADSICERYLLPENVMRTDRIDALIDARDHIEIKFDRRSDGIRAYSLGMQKFALPEYEILNLIEEDCPRAHRFLMTISQHVLRGDITKLGDKFGSHKCLFTAADGGFDKKFWQGLPVFELLPPTRMTPTEALQEWIRETES